MTWQPRLGAQRRPGTAGRQACLQVFGSKEEFLDALAASSGQAVVIKLRGDGYSLKGYITL